MSPASEVIARLKGKSLATAESLTGGGIGAALTGVPGASEVYRGGIVSYTNGVKEAVLGVPGSVLETFGAVSMETAVYMAKGARQLLNADIAVSATGLAGPGGDAFGHPVGTVFIGYSSRETTFAGEYHFSGDRAAVRAQTVEAALRLILEQNPE